MIRVVVVCLLVLAGQIWLPNTIVFQPGNQVVQAEPENASRPRTKARTIFRGGCRIREQGKTWRLLDDCHASGTIQLPKNISFNGQNHQITITGSLRRYRSAALVGSGGRVSIRNLKLQGKDLSGPCPTSHVFAAIRLDDTSAVVRNVSIHGLRHRSGCVYGISSDGIQLAPSLVIVNSRFTVIDSAAIIGRNLSQVKLSRNLFARNGSQLPRTIDLVSIGALTISQNRLQVLANGIGIAIANGARGQIAHNSIVGRLSSFGISLSESNVAVTSNTIHGMYVGIFAWMSVLPISQNDISAMIGVFLTGSGTANLVGNTISGLPGGPTIPNTDGARFDALWQGTIAQNTISGYNCGITGRVDQLDIRPDNNLSGNASPVCDTAP